MLENIRYIKRIDTTNKKNKFVADDTIHFDLPHNKVDLSSFKIYVDVQVDSVQQYNGNSWLKRFMPRNAFSFIDTLIIEKDGVAIQEIKDYNILHNILYDASNEKDDICGDRTDTLNHAIVQEADGIPNEATDINTNAGRSPLKYKLFIDTFLGLINESSYNYLDCNKSKYRISIKLAPRYITYRGLDNNIGLVVNQIYDEWTYRLSNVYANIDVVPQDTAVPSSMVFKNYKTITGAQASNKDITLKGYHKGKINYILSSFIVKGERDEGLQLEHCNEDEDKFGSMFQNTYIETVDINGVDYEMLAPEYEDLPFITHHITPEMVKMKTTVNNLNNSIYFRRDATNLKTAKYSVNGVDITPDMSMIEIYGAAKEFFNKEMRRVKSLASFETEFFAFPIIINQKDKDFVNQVELICTGGNTRQDLETYPIMFICHDVEISI